MVIICLKLKTLGTQELAPKLMSFISVVFLYCPDLLKLEYRYDNTFL